MKITVKKQGLIGSLADMLMVPIMYIVSGTFRETPQRTHFWNNIKINKEEVSGLDVDKMVLVKGDPGAYSKGLVRFHLPILGGWKKYIVVEPTSLPRFGWYVGWTCPFVSGISMIQLRGPVRLLVGPGDVQFFATDSCGRQITLKKVGSGVIGEGLEFSRIPLL